MQLSADSSINREPHAIFDSTSRSATGRAEMLRRWPGEGTGTVAKQLVSMVSTNSTPLGIIHRPRNPGRLPRRVGACERKDHLQSIHKNTRRMAGLMEEVLLIGASTRQDGVQAAPMDFGSFSRRLVDESSATDRRCQLNCRLMEFRRRARHEFVEAHFHKFTDQCGEDL